MFGYYQIVQKMAKILTISEQLHVYKEIENLFEGLTKAQRESIIDSLGLSDIFDGNGGLAPMYSLDIISDSEYFLNPGISHTINLSTKLYNYSNEIDADRVIEWKWTRISGDSSDDTWIRVDRNITITDEDLTNRIKDNFVSFTCQATLDDGTKIYDTVRFSNSLTLSSVQIQSTSNMFLGNSPAKILFTAVVKGFTATQYSWFLNNTLVSSTRSYDMPNSAIADNSIGNLRLEAKDAKGNIHTDTRSISKLKEAKDGEPGVPGPIGPGGKPTYTWIKYADNDEGTEDFSEYPVKLDGSFRQYIGYAYNKESPLESDNPADYQWAKYVGDQGIPGENGYMWITYSQWPEGLDTNGTVDVSEDPYDEVAEEYMVYMGIAYNKQEQQEPNFNAMTQAEFKEVGFLWAKIKGEDGHTAYVVDLSNEVAGIPTDSDGKVISDTSYLGATGILSLSYGNTIVPGSEWFADAVASDSSIKFTFQRDNNTGKYTFALTSINGLVSDSGSIVFTVKSQETNPKEIGKATFSFTKMKGIAAYNIVTSRSEIKVTPQTDGSVIIDPTKLTVKVMKNTGIDYKETLEGSLNYRYSWDKTGDGNPFDPPTEDGTYTLNVSNANNPSHIEIFYYHPIVNNKIVDRETIPFVRDGSTGSPGEDGTSSELRYRKSSGDTVIPPLDKTKPIPDGWELLPQSLTAGEALWMIKSTKKSNGSLVGTWSDPVKLNGASGIPGDRGPSPRMLEWVVGYTYVNNNDFRDYVLFRSEDPVYDGWYVPTGKTAVANVGVPDTLIFTKQPFTDSGMFGTLIAEGANIGGLILRNQQLKSQAETNGKPNILINGKTGVADFVGAKLQNSTFSSGQTGSQRIEISSNKNAMEFYLDGKNNPSVTVAASDNASGGNNAIENPMVETRGIVRGTSTSTSFMSNSGLFSNGSNMYFWSSSAGGPNNSACVVGLYQENDDDTNSFDNSQGVIRAAVVGRHYYEKNEGKTFGGYFSSILYGGKYQEFMNMPTANGTYNANISCSLYICTANSGTTVLNLPLMATLNTSGNWNRHLVGFILEVVMYADNADVRIVSQNGSTSIYLGTTNAGEIKMLNSGVMKMLWNGTQWIPLFTKNFGT